MKGVKQKPNSYGLIWIRGSEVESLWRIHIKLCENTKNFKSAYPGSNKVVYGACEQDSEEKKENFWFFNMQN